MHTIHILTSWELMQHRYFFLTSDICIAHIVIHDYTQQRLAVAQSPKITSASAAPNGRTTNTYQAASGDGMVMLTRSQEQVPARGRRRADPSARAATYPPRSERPCCHLPPRAHAATYPPRTPSPGASMRQLCQILSSYCRRSLDVIFCDSCKT